ncbi:MAG: transglutaminase domain-containing protein [Euryarchaeota archaeon]|nr:transglutaminase domain-containing protein [Euryarchaeota archaeon]
MKRLASVLILLTILSVSWAGCLGGGIVGFTQEDLTAPEIAKIPRNSPTLPSPSTATTPVYQYTLRWSMSEVYVGFGGAMSLEVENTGMTTLFVYGYGLKWVNHTEEFFRQSSVYVSPGETEDLGILSFRAPSAAKVHMYTIMLNVSVSTPAGTAWHDYGTVNAADRAAEVKGLISAHDYSIEKNEPDYYNRINSRIDTEAVEGIVANIKSAFPGEYNTLQIASAFDWVKEHIAYLSDVGGDYWQSTQETLEKGTGDCEDQAIILSSIITALGGNARVNIIENHAFATVFISYDLALQENARRSLSSYYGTDLRLCTLNDEFGFWLVVDTAGYMHAGGLPAESSPTSYGGWEWWGFDTSDWLITVDVTGEVEEGGFWPF